MILQTIGVKKRVKQILILSFYPPGQPPVRYSIVSGDPDHRFTIEPMTGAIRVTAQLDRETTPSYLLNVRAANGNPSSFDQTQVRELYEVNDKGQF